MKTKSTAAKQFHQRLHDLGIPAIPLAAWQLLAKGNVLVIIDLPNGNRLVQCVEPSATMKGLVAQLAKLKEAP